LMIYIPKLRAQHLLVWNNAPPHIRRLSPNNNNVPDPESGHTKNPLHREKIPQRRRPLI